MIFRHGALVGVFLVSLAALAGGGCGSVSSGGPGTGGTGGQTMGGTGGGTGGSASGSGGAGSGGSGSGGSGSGGVVGGSGGSGGVDGGLGPDISMSGSGGSPAPDGNVPDAVDASGADAPAADLGTQAARLACIDQCEATHHEGVSTASLNGGDCCAGACNASCFTDGDVCFGHNGRFGQPKTDKLVCQSCAIAPWRAGTCGANCRDGDCKAYIDCVSTCL